MKNKAVMKMAKMAGDSRTAMKMKAEDAAMKMKKQSAMKMKDPMDMKKDPMKMKKRSAMKKKTDDDDKFMTEEELDTFYKNQKDEGETKIYPANHPRSKRLKKIKDDFNSGKISFEQMEQLNNQVLTDPKYSSPKTMKKGAMKKMGSPNKIDLNFKPRKNAKEERRREAKRDFLKNWKTLSDEQKRKVPTAVTEKYGVTKPKNPAKGRLGGLDSMAQK